VEKNNLIYRYERVCAVRAKKTTVFIGTRVNNNAIVYRPSFGRYRPNELVGGAYFNRHTGRHKCRPVNIFCRLVDGLFDYRATTSFWAKITIIITVL